MDSEKNNRFLFKITLFFSHFALFSLVLSIFPLLFVFISNNLLNLNFENCTKYSSLEQDLSVLIWIITFLVFRNKIKRYLMNSTNKNLKEILLISIAIVLSLSVFTLLTLHNVLIRGCVYGF